MKNKHYYLWEHLDNRKISATLKYDSFPMGEKRSPEIRHRVEALQSLSFRDASMPDHSLCPDAILNRSIFLLTGFIKQFPSFIGRGAFTDSAQGFLTVLSSGIISGDLWGTICGAGIGLGCWYVR